VSEKAADKKPIMKISRSLNRTLSRKRGDSGNAERAKPEGFGGGKEQQGTISGSEPKNSERHQIGTVSPKNQKGGKKKTDLGDGATPKRKSRGINHRQRSDLKRPRRNNREKRRITKPSSKKFQSKKGEEKERENDNAKALYLPGK